MRFSSSGFVALAVMALVGCSGKTLVQRAPSESDSGGPGGSSSGGRSAGSGGSGTAGGSGGTSSTGSGGFDPGLAQACGVDAGVNACRTCLAVTCCDAAQACFGDAKCAAAFGPYQVCVKETPDDVSRCYSDFTRTILADSRTHEPFLTCIALGGCQVCGGPGAL